MIGEIYSGVTNSSYLSIKTDQTVPHTLALGHSRTVAQRGSQNPTLPALISIGTQTSEWLSEISTGLLILFLENINYMSQSPRTKGRLQNRNT